MPKKKLKKKRKKRRSTRWKGIEAEAASYFGGTRVPLSGSNSRHGTSSDALGVPPWLYLEAKRDKRYHSFFYPYYGSCIANNSVFIFNTSCGEVCLFCLNKVAVPVTLEYVDTGIDYEEKKVVPQAIQLFEEGLFKCKAEGREVLLLAFKIHALYGIYCLTE
jgi:hypothetical protein